MGKTLTYPHEHFIMLRMRSVSYCPNMARANHTGIVAIYTKGVTDTWVAHVPQSVRKQQGRSGVWVIATQTNGMSTRTGTR